MNLELEILQYNYWEHFKSAKDLHKVLAVNHPRILAIELEMKSILEKINKINNEHRTTS